MKIKCYKVIPLKINIIRFFSQGCSDPATLPKYAPVYELFERKNKKV